jgi:hypothetical protein
VFLGWERAPLAVAAEWLIRTRGEDMGDLLVALPGSRAKRLLLDHLTRRQPPSWAPPRMLTVGELTDEVLVRRGRSAERALRTLAWEGSLRALPRERLQGLMARPPEDGDALSWARLAEAVRALFGQLAAEGLDFAHVARDSGLVAGGERLRWRVLAEAQAGMVERLAREGFVDPHLGRLEALEAGGVLRSREVVLVGVVEMNAIQKRTIEALGERVHVLVTAPESERPTSTLALAASASASSTRRRRPSSSTRSAAAAATSASSRPCPTSC